MTRVPLDVAATIAEVQPGTVRVWLTRGLITRHPHGIDLYELMHWLDTTRNMEQARGAAVAAHNRHRRRRYGA